MKFIFLDSGSPVDPFHPGNSPGGYELAGRSARLQIYVNSQWENE